MGIALVLEGFMSSFYHICPNDANFQFGTFSYILQVHVECHACDKGITVGVLKSVVDIHD